MISIMSLNPPLDYCHCNLLLVFFFFVISSFPDVDYGTRNIGARYTLTICLVAGQIRRNCGRVSRSLRDDMIPKEIYQTLLNFLLFHGKL